MRELHTSAAKTEVVERLFFQLCIFAWNFNSSHHLVFSHSRSSRSPGVYPPFHVAVSEPVVKGEDCTSNSCLPLLGLPTNTQNGGQQLCFVDINFTTHRWHWTSGSDSTGLIEETIEGGICYKCFLKGSCAFGNWIDESNEIFHLCSCDCQSCQSGNSLLKTSVTVGSQSSVEAKCTRAICVC